MSGTRHVANMPRYYDELLAHTNVKTPAVAEYAEHVYHLYVIRVDERDELKARLQDQSISTGIHYPIPLHLQPAYEYLGHREGDFPVSEEYAEKILSLPMYPELQPSSILFIGDAIVEFQRGI